MVASLDYVTCDPDESVRKVDGGEWVVRARDQSKGGGAGRCTAIGSAKVNWPLDVVAKCLEQPIHVKQRPGGYKMAESLGSPKGAATANMGSYDPYQSVSMSHYADPKSPKGQMKAEMPAVLRDEPVGNVMQAKYVVPTTSAAMAAKETGILYSSSNTKELLTSNEKWSRRDMYRKFNDLDCATTLAPPRNNSAMQALKNKQLAAMSSPDAKSVLL